MDSLSDYEKLRLANIRANEAFLKELGLGSQAALAPAPQSKEKKTRKKPRRKRAREAERLQPRRACQKLSAPPPVTKRALPFDRPADVFGTVEGVPVGAGWEWRADACRALVHRATVAGIVGSPELGCYSIVLNGGYPDDVDLGDALTYTGSGGRKKHSGAVVTDQSLTDGKNAALAKSVKTGLPVRVLRGYKLNSKYAPLGLALGGKHNYRYDGLYRVTRAWMSKSLQSEALVCKFALMRLEGQPPLATRAEGGGAGAGAGAAATAAAPTEAWQTDPTAHPCIGEAVARCFSGGSVVATGRVVGWLPAGDEEEDFELFRVQHDHDGDEEDLERHELDAALALAAQEAAWRTDPSASPEIGKVVARRYGDGGDEVVAARVVAWLPAGDDPTEDFELFRIRHEDDGDVEDLERHELDAALALAAANF